jgi:hypothetical protein
MAMVRYSSTAAIIYAVPDAIDKHNAKDKCS